MADARVDNETESERAGHAITVVTRGPRARWWARTGSSRRGFRYVDPEGHRIVDRDQIARIRALRIPPAWREVKISPSPRHRLQALGIDAAGRVQYLYHPEYAARRQRIKYSRIERFGERLPLLRRMTNADITREGLPRERVLAVVIRLINELHFRVGSESGTARYRTFGVTTLRNRHLRIRPHGVLRFSFDGKGHIRQRRVLVDEDLARLVAEIKAIGGSRLFEYLDQSGEAHAVTAKDVNDYIKHAMGPEFSAKDFRTWAGTQLAAIELAELGPAPSRTALKRAEARVCRSVGERLGNTPAVCRASYIHPAVFERYEEGVTLSAYRGKAERITRREQPEYLVEEAALLELLSASH